MIAHVPVYTCRHVSRRGATWLVSTIHFRSGDILTSRKLAPADSGENLASLCNKQCSDAKMLQFPSRGVQVWRGVGSSAMSDVCIYRKIFIC